MKFKLPIGVCVLISLALVLFGLLFGTMTGFTEDRRQVTALLEGENGLLDVLSYRGADGLNLCVVARRHLSNDLDVAALEKASNQLRNESESLASKKQVDTELGSKVEMVAQKLAQTQSFKESNRDGKYLDMLTTDLQNLSSSAMITTYNTAAKDFNTQLNAPVIGDLAKMLGVKPCELYQ